MKYLAIVDFEATCWEDSKDHEIIEFPTVIVNLEDLKIVDKFQVFVKPKHNPTVSAFCHGLTGITQEQVNNGVELAVALKQHQKFMSKYEDSIIVTCGVWDLEEMLPRDAKRCSIKLPTMYRRYINVKDIYKSMHNLNRAPGMTGMLAELNLELEGRHHSGLDDSINIARICIELIKRGAVLDKFIRTLN